MTALNKHALRQLATDAHELGIIKRYTKGVEANKRFAAIATPLIVLALLDEVETATDACNGWQRKYAEADERLRAAESGFAPLTVERLIREKEDLEKRIAELESRTVTVKPPNGDRDIAAFRIDPTEGPSWLTFRCEEDLRENGVIGEFDSVVPLSLITNDVPKRGEVVVTVSALTGSGKSAIAGEIEIAMKAIGVPVKWMNGDAEKRMTGADWLTAIEMYKPTVRIVEVNVPRAAGIGVKGE